MTVIPPTCRRIIAAGLTVLGMAALGGCDRPGHAPASASPSSKPLTSARPSPTPSPSPTGPVRAADNPSWTADQLAAVRVVDAFYEVDTRIVSDPAGANFGELLTVATEPLYSKLVRGTQELQARGEAYVGASPYSIRVSIRPSAVTTVDGRPEIHLIECHVDNPAGQWIQNNGPVDVGSPESLYDLAVQQVDGQGWRVVAITTVRETC